MSAPIVTVTVGPMLRGWRERRRLSQLDLALTAGTSTRHLSWVETGRATPSRAMVLRLAEHLDVPIRARNDLLLAAGHAPAYPASAFDAPPMQAVRDALDLVLAGHQPYPALVFDAGWDLVQANPAFQDLLTEVHPRLLAPPVNIIRLALHPDGLSPAIVNLTDWHAHLSRRISHRVALTADLRSADLLKEISSYRPAVPPQDGEVGPGYQLVMPLHLRLPDRELRLFSTVATFGTPLDVTVAELALETFFPYDPTTKATLHNRQ